MKSSERGRGYLVLGLVGFFSAFSFTAVAPVLPLYVESFGASYEQLGLLFSAYSLTWTVLQVYTGYLADRWGRRRVAMLGYVIFAAFALLSYTAQSFAQLLFFRILQGVGLGVLGPSVLGLAAGFKEKGKSFAFYRAANGAGDVLGPIAGGFLGDFALREPFLLSALAACLAGGAMLAMKEAEVARSEARFSRAIAGLVRNRAFLLICVAGFLAELGYASFKITIPLVGEGLELSPKEIGMVLSSYALSFAVFQVPIGLYADKAGKKGLLVVASGLSALSFFGLYAAQGFLPLVLLMALLGITLGAIFVQATALAADVVAEKAQAMSLAFFDALIDLSFAVMPLIVGAVARFGASIPFLACSLFLVAAAILFQLVERSRAEARSSPRDGVAPS